jgi:hypothetical protein
MAYEDSAPAVDKWLHADGSVTTLAGEAVLPANSERAAEYERREPNAAKWLMPDGTIATALPFSGDGSEGSHVFTSKTAPTAATGKVGDICVTPSGVYLKKLTPTCWNYTLSGASTAFNGVWTDMGINETISNYDGDPQGSHYYRHENGIYNLCWNTAYGGYWWINTDLALDDGEATAYAQTPTITADPPNAGWNGGISDSVVWTRSDPLETSENWELCFRYMDDRSDASLRIFFAETATAYSTINKVLTGLPEGYTPQSGDVIFMTYKTATQNSAVSPKFDIGGTVYDILFAGVALNSVTNNWRLNMILPFYFDGTQFHQLYLPRTVDNNTTYTIPTGFFEMPLTGFYLKINPERTIDRYQLCLERADGTFDKACTAAYSTSTTKAVNTATDFKVDGLIWFNNSASSYTMNTIYSASSTQVIQTYQSSYIMTYALNGNAGLTTYSWLYLVGIPKADNPLLYRLDSASPTSWYTTTPPTSDDGKVYIRLGRYHTGNVFSLMAEHPAYWFKDGAFRPYLTRGESQNG